MSTKCSRPDSLFQPTLPARGATGRQEWAYFRRNDFNPRSPHGERRQTAQKSADTTHHFNPRSLHGERLYRHGMALQHCIISIHAPCTGSDCTEYTQIIRASYFNPRSPHGERQFAIDFADKPMGFQSTLPARGATRLLFHRVDCAGFQSTLPARGATAMHGIETDSGELISIHAPRTGSDARRACAAG